MYNDFAFVYDKLMAEVPYDKWVTYFEQIFAMMGLSPKLVLDLGCGTGTLTAKLAQKGYDMIGVDASAEMLSLAREKAPGTLFLNQDMTDFELYGTVDAIVSSLDSVNYITDADALLQCFRLAENYLNYHGLLIFDINSSHRLQTFFGNRTLIEETDDYFYTWENEFHPDTRICDFYLNIFMRQVDGYTRIEEAQAERAYTVAQLRSLLKQARLQLVGVYDGFTFRPPTPNSERIFFVARCNREKRTI